MAVNWSRDLSGFLTANIENYLKIAAQIQSCPVPVLLGRIKSFKLFDHKSKVARDHFEMVDQLRIL